MMTPKLNTETFQTLIDRTGNQEQKSHNLYAKGGRGAANKTQAEILGREYENVYSVLIEL